MLLKQKSTKSRPPYDPDPYTVISIPGHQITAFKGSQQKTRDAQKWKPVSIRTPTNYNLVRDNARKQQLIDTEEDIFDLHVPQGEERAEFIVNTTEERPAQPPPQTVAPRYPRRERQEPDRYGDWVNK